MSYVLMAATLYGCASAPKPNPLKMLAIEECAEDRRAANGFNARKNPLLVRHECEQILSLDETYIKIGNRKSSYRNPHITYSDEQEYFDDETWFLVTEHIRKNHYPTYLSPEEELARANLLNEKQKTIKDKSILRQYDPRLLPVSPYLMSHRELGWASEAVSDLTYKNRENKKLHNSLRVISLIILRESHKREGRAPWY